MQRCTTVKCTIRLPTRRRSSRWRTAICRSRHPEYMAVVTWTRTSRTHRYYRRGGTLNRVRTAFRIVCHRSDTVAGVDMRNDASRTPRVSKITVETRIECVPKYIYSPWGILRALEMVRVAKCILHQPTSVAVLSVLHNRPVHSDVWWLGRCVRRLYQRIRPRCAGTWIQCVRR